MLLMKVLFALSVVSTCSCWYYYNNYYNPYYKYFTKPYSYFNTQNSNCERWCYSYTTPHIHCCVYKDRPINCPYAFVYCAVPLAPEFTSHFQCNGDFDCPMGYKCCPDSCFSHNICKSHNVEWVRWNTYSYPYTQGPSTEETRASNVTVSSPIASTSPEASTSGLITTTPSYYTTSDFPQTGNKIRTEDISNETLIATSGTPKLEGVPTTDASVSTLLENVTTIEEDSNPNGNETITPTTSKSTTQDAFGALMSIFGKKETETDDSNKTKENGDNSGNSKEIEVAGSNGSDTSEISGHGSTEAAPAIEGSGSESANEEGSGTGDGKEDLVIFVDDDDIERKRRSNFRNTKKSQEGKFEIDVDGVSNDKGRNVGLFFDSNN